MPATLYDYWQDIYERKVLLLIVVISAALFGYLISLALPPLYEAKATFYAPSNLSLPAYTRSDSAGHFAQGPFLPTADEKAAAVDIGILLSMDMYRTLHEKFPQREVAALKKNIDVTVSGEFMIDVHVRDKDPQLAADIANAMPALYREFHVRVLRARLIDEVETLNEQLGRLDHDAPDLLVSADSGEELSEEQIQLKVEAERVRKLKLQADQYRVGQQVRDEMTRNLMEAKLQLEDPPVEIVIVETGVAATKPVFPLPVLNAVVAGLTGIAAGSYYALLMGYLARLKKVRIRREMDWSPLVDGRFIEFVRGRSNASLGQ